MFQIGIMLKFRTPKTTGLFHEGFLRLVEGLISCGKIETFYFWI